MGNVGRDRKTQWPCDDPLPYALAEYNAKHDLELNTHACAEAQVAALADDIAYNNHDLHDGLRAGLFTDDEVAALPLVGPCFARWTKNTQTGPAPPPKRGVAPFFGVMVEDVLRVTRDNLSDLDPQSAQDIAWQGAQWRSFHPIFGLI